LPVRLPHWLADQGLAAVIPPLPAADGRLWASLGPATLIVSPFVAGRDGYQAPLTEAQWRALGRALRALHAAHLPPWLEAQVPRESYTPRSTGALRTLLARLPGMTPDDPVAAELLRTLAAERTRTLDLIRRAEHLAEALQADPPPTVLCHADIHAGNVLVGSDGSLHIVDWDDAILAPKERDLMFIGAGLWGGHRTPQEEERLFYRGYGPTEIDPVAIAYYRYARIVEDVAIFSRRILAGPEGREDRELCLRYLRSNFAPGGTIEQAVVARRSTITRPAT
jgi:spectinomycin phosphotransferase